MKWVEGDSIGVCEILNEKIDNRTEAGGKLVELDPHSPVPLYYQLKETLREGIISGSYPTESPFPSESVLCAQYNVSRFTVRQAVGDLVREGLLVRLQGKGTFVRAQKIDQDLRGFHNFSQEMTAKGHSITTQILAFTSAVPRRRHRELFEIDQDERVFQIFRLRLIDAEPVILEKIYLPARHCPDLNPIDVSSTPRLYKLLTEKSGLELESVSKALEPSIADQYEASMLNIRAGSAVLLIDRVTYTREKKAVVLSTWVVRGDRCRHYINPETT